MGTAPTGGSRAGPPPSPMLWAFERLVEAVGETRPPPPPSGWLRRLLRPPLELAPTPRPSLSAAALLSSLSTLSLALAVCSLLFGLLVLKTLHTVREFGRKMPVSVRGLRSLLFTVSRRLLRKGCKRPGELTGLIFPVEASELTGPGGGKMLEHLLRQGGHLPAGVHVQSVHVASGQSITDGVKGDKHVLLIEYTGVLGSVGIKLPPARLFAKFGIGSRLHPMRILSDATSTARCEATFYARICREAERCGLGSPKCYFADYSESTGESCLLLEVLPFGEADLLPLRHRIRDPPRLSEIRAFVAAGCRLNARFWGAHGGGDECMRGVPTYFELNEARTAMAQMLALRGLAHSARRTLGGASVNPAFMTWDPPAGIIGSEPALIALLPVLAESLCSDASMLAFGHNDIVTDNAYFWREPTRGRATGRAASGATFGLFDWQQACINNVGHEWAWNFHFLPPDFLEEHEPDLIELILRTYAAHGIVVPRWRFCRSYALACAHLYVWGGGAMQPLMRRLQRAGLFDNLAPNDPRHASGWPDVTPSQRETLIGAEMTRRTLTNACAIMRRHGFVEHWERWRQELEAGKR